MKHEIKSYKLTIFNTQYTVVSDEKEELLLQYAAYIDTVMQDIASRSRLQDVQKIAVLAALKIAHTMFDLENTVTHCLQQNNNLIKHIDQEIEKLAQP